MLLTGNHAGCKTKQVCRPDRLGPIGWPPAAPKSGASAARKSQRGARGGSEGALCSGLGRNEPMLRLDPFDFRRRSRLGARSGAPRTMLGLTQGLTPSMDSKEAPVNVGRSRCPHFGHLIGRNFSFWGRMPSILATVRNLALSFSCNPCLHCLRKVDQIHSHHTNLCW